ncbi:MAG: hypothetical protein ABTQ34_04585 [Bdellovibrionales bacterium]
MTKWNQRIGLILAAQVALGRRRSGLTSGYEVLPGQANLQHPIDIFAKLALGQHEPAPRLLAPGPIRQGDLYECVR